MALTGLPVTTCWLFQGCGIGFVERSAQLKGTASTRLSLLEFYSNIYINGAQTKRPATKRPETKHPWTKHPWGQNVHGDKTSVATKRPSDKTDVGTKGPSDKTSVGQNVRGDKTSVGTKHPWTKHPWTKRPSGSYLPGSCEAIFTDKNLLSVKEKSAFTHTLTLVSVF